MVLCVFFHLHIQSEVIKLWQLSPCMMLLFVWIQVQPLKAPEPQLRELLNKARAHSTHPMEMLPASQEKAELKEQHKWESPVGMKMVLFASSHDCCFQKLAVCT